MTIKGQELMRNALINISLILLTALITGFGTYNVFSQKLVSMEEKKANKEDVSKIQQEVVKLTEKIENNTQAVQELKVVIKQNDIRRDEREEKLRDKIDKNSQQQAQLIGQLKILIDKLKIE